LQKTYKENEINVKIIIEPGRYLVCEAGVILSHVTQIKDKNDEHKYIGIDCGMNTLIRPSYYNAYHEIINLSNEKEEKKQ